MGLNIRPSLFGGIENGLGNCVYAHGNVVLESRVLKDSAQPARLLGRLGLDLFRQVFKDIADSQAV